MKLALATILFTLVISFVVCANPHQLFLDFPIAESIGDPGTTACRLDLSLSRGLSLDVGRAITDRVDIWMRTTPSDLFSLNVRALLVDHAGPLCVSLDYSKSGITLLSSLSLGPVQVDWGRVFGHEHKRWVTITASANQWYSLLFGVEYETDWVPIGALRIFPRRGAWALSLYYREGRWGASIGGAL